jgi:phosphatidylglycerol:prolipoprotein diacylglycerol transferase
MDLYYYGLAYAIGFLGIHIWVRMRRRALGWSLPEVYDFCILFSLGVLLLGRVFAVVVYHWDYYSGHPDEVLSYWRGGMATHGVLLGGVSAMLLFCQLRGKSFLRLADEVVIPAAFFLALGRIGNFINGQISGTITNVWWAVKFPNVDGFRHPVTLYESLKNLILIPILLIVRRLSSPGRGMMAAHFILWYGFLRIFADIYRDHGAQLFGIGRNQYFNALMAVLGLVLIGIFARRTERQGAEYSPQPSATRDGRPGNPLSSLSSGESVPAFWLRRIAFAIILLFCLVVRSAWTPEVLEKRRAEGRAAHTSVHVGEIR